MRKLTFHSGLCVGLLAAAAFGQTVEVVPDQVPEDSAGEKPDAGAGLDRVERMVVERVNAFRRQHGRAGVSLNFKLERTVENFAGFMAETDKYGHQADGRQPSQRARRNGYEYCIISENIAWVQSTTGCTPDQLADQLVSGWKNSPGHRKNMLEVDVTDTGVAVARSGASDRYYAVQMFGRPKSAIIEFQITNKSNTTVEYRTGGTMYRLRPRYTRTHGACRPPSLQFPLPESAFATTRPATAEADEDAIYPQDGARFVVRRSDEGKLILDER